MKFKTAYDCFIEVMNGTRNVDKPEGYIAIDTEVSCNLARRQCLSYDHKRAFQINARFELIARIGLRSE